MEPIKPVKTFKVYTVIKQTGLSMSYVYGSSSPSSVTFGPGFYGTREEAEQLRTVEILKDTTSGNKYHVFELEIPNPVYQE
jgi:hypothetical protein